MCAAGIKSLCVAVLVLVLSVNVQAHQAADSGTRTVEVSHAARQHELSQAALMRRTSRGALVHEGATVTDTEPPVPNLQPKAEASHVAPAHHMSALEHPVVQKLAEWFAIASPDPIRSASLAEDRVQMEKSLHQKEYSASANSSTTSLVSVIPRQDSNATRRPDVAESSGVEVPSATTLKQMIATYSKVQLELQSLGQSEELDSVTAKLSSAKLELDQQRQDGKRLDGLQGDSDPNKGNLSHMETTKDTGGCGDEWNDGKKVEWCDCIKDGDISEKKVKMSDFMKCEADGTPTNLDDTKAQEVHKIIATEPAAECDLLKLATFCLKKTECLGEHHIASCKKDKAGISDCDVDCGHASRNSILSAVLASVLAATALFDL